ncbi:MAG: exodeoxyribonuclease VII large subunit [Candidatus Omnitrophica bacterium]|nr:exodeoxyribonuclease VII large subunit [Candidatus Omnitrophota bacterium]MDD5236591.1 exodeoxyribonuclease VII large subunit [Candidatus Omnitrophota bacterium]MDD5610719.1 exodeoxyribonuclease VII large subunit [Candidatus Omnitrophota bacterium]
MPEQRTIDPKATHIYTVSELSKDIKLILENTFPEVWVEGEISNFSAPPSGHLYFTLKDEASVLSAAMFSRAAKDLKFKIEDGLKAVCFGKVSAYGARGQYQIIVEKIEPKGVGGLQLALEQLKKKLEKEGLFSSEHKRPIPYLPSKIGVVTSLAGAAIRDILKVLDRRFSDTQLIISPAQVQGETAKNEIAQAILDLNRLNENLASTERIEVMIVGRGGGSMEDLWAFNEEIVARAIYNSKIPVISAVGHERDWTIADLVADVRAPTPSVAAELVMPKKEELRDKVNTLAQGLDSSFMVLAADLKDTIDELLHRLRLGIGHALELNSGRLSGVVKKLGILNPVLIVQQHQLKIKDLFRQANVRIEHFLKLKEAGFRTTVEKLSSLSPLNILGRGYSITFKMPELSVVKDIRSVKAGDKIKTRLGKGEVLSKIEEIITHG